MKGSFGVLSGCLLINVSLPVNTYNLTRTDIILVPDRRAAVAALARVQETDASLYKDVADETTVFIQEGIALSEKQ